MDAVRREINGLKESVARLDVTVARLDVTVARIDSTLNRVMITVAKIDGNMADMKNYLDQNMATKTDISSLNSRMDGFAGLLLDSRHRWAVHAETLTEHDSRLKKLESHSA